MKVLIGFILFVSLGQAYAQDIIFEKEIKLSRSFKDNREAFPVTNSEDNHVGLFLLDNSAIHGFLFDQNLNMLMELAGERPPNKFADLLGSNIENGSHNLFFATRSRKNLACLSFDFAGKTIKQYLLELPLAKEHYVSAISYENKFYILTVVKNSSVLNLYVFDNHNHYEIKTYDFGKEHFNSDPYYFTLYNVLHDPTVNVVDNEIPNSLDLTSAGIKVYCFNHKIILTLDNQLSRTGVISIDTNTLEEKLEFFPQPGTSCKNVSMSANSYIYNNLLYQLKVCNSEMTFSIRDLETNEIIKDYHVTDNQEITFKNTPIIQEKNTGSWTGDNERILSKTKQFLRKVASADAGISAYKIGSSVEVTLGGYVQIQRATGSGGGFAPGGSMMTPGGPVPVMVYNPTYYGYGSYKLTKSTYFKSLLDPATFEHQTGVVPQNAFDKIHLLTEEIDNKTSAHTIFKKDGDLILGYYLKAEDKYVMRRYSDH